MDKRFASRRLGWRRVALQIVLLSSLSAAAIEARTLNLSRADAVRIGKRIWQNECGGTVAGLTSWNVGENFASLGIGHFIWYPDGVRGPFEESFPKLVTYLSQRDIAGMPPFLKTPNPACPWKSRAEFLAAQKSGEMNQLRQFLAATVDVQAEFLVNRLDDSLAKMLREAAPDQRANVERQFERVGSTAQGCYALVDYVNFKGEGVLPTERYRGEGWGLLQVLDGMHGNGSGPSAAQEFAGSAKAVLSRRVHNAPAERKETRWLPGWLHRVATYGNS